MLGSLQRQQPAISANVAAAESELDMVSELFNKLVESCHKKCIDVAYRDDDLNKGESVCVDRCVSKFFSVYKSVGNRLKEKSQEQQQQQMALFGQQ